MYIDKENNNVFIFEKLNSLKKSLDKDTLNLEEVRRKMTSVSEVSNYDEMTYFKDLMDPINRKTVKIPTQSSVPSCTFQLHNSFTFSSNNEGMDLFYFNPFFLCNTNFFKRFYPKGDGQHGTFNENVYPYDKGCGTYFANIELYANGESRDKKNWYFPSGSVSQVIPDVYDKYRVVSACMTLRYTGQLDEVKGVMGGGITYQKNRYLGFRYDLSSSNPSGLSGSRNPELDIFGTLEPIRDSVYFRENLAVEGLKMLYYPIDNSFQQFYKVFDGSEKVKIIGAATEVTGTFAAMQLPKDNLPAGFGWIVYLQGVPTGSKCFKLDYYINYECLPKAELLNYIPITINNCYITPQLRDKFIEEVKKKSITKVNSFNLINNI